MKTLGETIKFNQDLNVNFDANLIDFLDVYNPSFKQFTKCEHWGWEEEKDGLSYYDFGMIADFHFSITKEKTSLYFGDSPYIGFYENNPTKLYCLAIAQNCSEGFVELGFFNFEKEYPAPKTMLDLANFIDNFLAERMKEVLIKSKKHKENYTYKPTENIIL